MTAKEDNKWSAFFVSRWFLAIIFLVLCFTGFAILRSYFQEHQIREEINRLKSEAGELESKKIETLEILKYVKSPEFIEEKARTEFNMQKEGERLVVIKDLGEAPSSSGLVNDKMIESNIFSNPIKWWNLFTGK